MRRPRILIPIPTSFDEPYNLQCWPEYADAVTAAGGEAVALSLGHSVAQVQALAAEADGILLPGSPADVDPARYGHERQDATAPPDALRESTDFALLEYAELHTLPLLGICMGLQTMNTFYGGTLIQNLDPLPVNHGAGRAVQAAHAVLVEPGSRLFDWGTQTLDFVVEDDARGRIAVNSSHHQAVDITGTALRKVGSCRQDGVVEAVEAVSAKTWLVGVQWHPERTLHTSSLSPVLFKAFVQACSRRQTA